MAKLFCESCGKDAEYTVYLVSALSRRAERYLCRTCAVNYERILTGEAGQSLVEQVDSLVAEQSATVAEQNRTKVCPKCGNNVENIVESGVAGCSVCYSVFKEAVEQAIVLWHGPNWSGRRKPG